MSKAQGKTLKEKRAEKKAKSTNPQSAIEGFEKKGGKHR